MPPPQRTSLLRRDDFTITTDAGTVAVVIRRDRRARNYTLRLSDTLGTPVLTMPAYGSLKEARSFLDSHTGWLARQIDKAPTPRPIVDGVTIPVRGIDHLVRHTPDVRGTVRVGVENGAPALFISGAAEHLKRRVFDYLRREARRDLESTAMQYADRLGVRPTAIRVRDTATRWGSCSSSGTLSFSFRLVMAPPYALDYLAAHEVAHLREMNHSRRFWRLVAGICPDFETARAWLQTEGRALQAVGAERQVA